MEMESRRKNREVAATIGDLVEILYREIEALPLSDPAKQALVMVMVSDIMHREGGIVRFYLPTASKTEVAA